MSKSANRQLRERWVQPYLKLYRKQLALALVLGVVTFAFSVLLMFTAGFLICETADVTLGILAAMTPVAFVQVFGIGKPLARYVERLVSHDWVFRVTSKLRLRLYIAFDAATSLLTRSRRTGELLGLLADDIGHLQNLFLRVLFPSVISLVLLVLVVLACGMFSWLFALEVLLVLFVIGVVLPLVTLLANRARLLRAKAMTGELYASLTDDVFGSTDWVFSGRGQDCIDEQTRMEEELRGLQRKTRGSQRISELVAGIVFGIGAVLVLVWAGEHFGGQLAGPSNWIAAFVIGFFPLADVFIPMTDVALSQVVHREALERLDEASSSSYEETQTTCEPSERPDICFDDVRFSYPDMSREALSGLSLEIPFGQHVAVLGRSGSGKSTLLALIHGELACTAGSCMLGGVPCEQMGEAAVRHVGVVSQQAYLFNRTLRENLQVGRADANDAELLDALDKVGLGPLVSTLPKGLSTMLGESGTRFSGGERHRIALARVLLADTDVVLLDEPFTALDPVTESDLLATLLEVFADKTLVMVTHHLQGIELFDRVVFVEDGRVAMQGSPDELARTNEHFARLLAFDRGIMAPETA